MSNSSHQKGSYFPGSSSQQVSSNPGHRTRASGLMPTDGQTGYKRASPSRASRRSRAERTSYLVATGHINPEETEHLHAQSDNSLSSGLQYFEQSPSISSPSISQQQNISDQPKLAKSHNSPRIIPNKRSNFDKSFMEDLNRTLANSPTIAPFGSQENAFDPSPKKKNSSKRGKKQLSQHGSRGDNGRGNFRQTYTEVTLPMKTSPAFEYILKDNERRNKRCCLWFIYSTLVTICLIIIIFCSVHLILKSH